MGRVNTNDFSSEVHSFMAKTSLSISSKQSFSDLHNVFQLKQAFIVFKCNVGKKLEHRRSHPCMCGKMSRQGDWQHFKGRVKSRRCHGVCSSARGACPPPESAGFVGISARLSWRRVALRLKSWLLLLVGERKITHFKRVTFHSSVLLIYWLVLLAEDPWYVQVHLWHWWRWPSILAWAHAGNLLASERDGRGTF